MLCMLNVTFRLIGTPAQDGDGLNVQEEITLCAKVKLLFVVGILSEKVVAFDTSWPRRILVALLVLVTAGAVMLALVLGCLV